MDVERIIDEIEQLLKPYALCLSVFDLRFGSCRNRGWKRRRIDQGSPKAIRHQSSFSFSNRQLFKRTNFKRTSLKPQSSSVQASILKLQ
jgi:hypothetical protein